jgi:hypothetical protein
MTVVKMLLSMMLLVRITHIRMAPGANVIKLFTAVSSDFS